MDTPIISVIVSMYNGEKYIKECIESIIRQDYKNLEILLVNDGSLDNSGKIAEEYKKMDNRITVIHQDNAGVSAARNNALDKSIGEYICILDQDDIISEDYINYLYGLCNKYHTDVALTPTVDKFFDKPHKDNTKESVEIKSGEETAVMMLYHNIVISPWNKMFSRKLIDDNGIRFNTKYFNGEGFAFSIECYLKADKVAIGNRKVYHYRVGDPETGASKFKEEYLLSSLGAQKYIKSKLHDSQNLINAWEYSNWHTHCDCLNIMIGCKAEKYYPELYKKLARKAKKDARVSLKAPVSKEQKIRGIMFRVYPKLASKVINRFRVRKFAKYVP